jgi:hypothetical protein
VRCALSPLLAAQQRPLHVVVRIKTATNVALIVVEIH